MTYDYTILAIYINICFRPEHCRFVLVWVKEAIRMSSFGTLFPSLKAHRNRMWEHGFSCNCGSQHIQGHFHLAQDSEHVLLKSCVQVLLET